MYKMDGQVRFSETDAKGRLSIGGVIDYFQDSSTFHSRAVGAGPEYLTKDNRAWIINYWQVEIFDLPMLGEKVSVETWPYSFRKFIGNRNYVLKNEAGDVCARADSIWALYDMKKNFPAVMTEEEIANYKIEPRLDMEERSRKIRVEAEFEECGSFIAMRDRLDSNLHMNNGQYIKLGTNYIPEGRDVSSVRVEYRSSIRQGDKVNVLKCEKDGLLYVKYDDQSGNEYSIIEFGFK